MPGCLLDRDQSVLDIGERLNDDLAIGLQQLGFLGALGPVTEFNLISDLPTSVQLSFYGSAFVLGTEGFPLAEIPLADIIAKAEAGRYKARPVRVFGFGEIIEAHRAMEEGAAGGKMVVAVS